MVGPPEAETELSALPGALAVALMLTALLGPPHARPLSQGPVADSTRSTLNGVYAPAQAVRGAGVYELTCRSCHTPASHAGPGFTGRWRGRPLSELFAFIRNSMPKSDPGSLTRQQYILVLSYLLKMNGLPAGKIELPADSLALSRILIEFKPDPDTTSQR